MTDAFQLPLIANMTPPEEPAAPEPEGITLTPGESPGVLIGYASEAAGGPLGLISAEPVEGLPLQWLMVQLLASNAIELRFLGDYTAQGASVVLTIGETVMRGDDPNLLQCVFGSGLTGWLWGPYDDPLMTDGVPVLVSITGIVP